MSKANEGYRGSADYIASKPLMEIVNVAVNLAKPLVIKGEPGTGKTLLAHSIAEALNKKLLIWNIKSTTKARDGLYVYDTVQRLNDARYVEFLKTHLSYSLAVHEVGPFDLSRNKEAGCGVEPGAGKTGNSVCPSRACRD